MNTPSVRTGRSVSRWRATLTLLLIALVPALVSTRFHPHKPTWTRDGEVTVAAVRAWPNVLWVDARAAAAYEKGHVPGSVKLSPGSWDAEVEAVLIAWSPGARVVVYCDGHGCQASREVAQRLRAELGLAEVYVLAGGWDAWQDAHP